MAADLLTLITVIVGVRVALLGGANVLPVGFLAGILATPCAVGGMAASQLFSQHGFGRRAGRSAAIAAVIVAVPILARTPPSRPDQGPTTNLAATRSADTAEAAVPGIAALPAGAHVRA